MPYLGSYAIDDYLTFAVNTHNNKGQARDADAVPSYRVYEDETTVPILTGNMALLDGTNTVGFYSERIQLTSANGFELEKIYIIYVTATVQGVQGTINHIFQIPTPASTFDPLTDMVIVSSGTVTNVTNPVSFSGDVTVSGTVDANIVSSSNIDFTILQKASLNASTPISVGAVTGGYVQVTGTVNANVIQISGDTTAADNLETATDGGAYNIGGGAVIAASVTADVGITQVGADKVWVSAARTLTSFGTLVADVITAVFVEAVEGTVTFRQWTRRVSAILFGKASGGGVAGSKKFRNLGDTVNRVDATTDASGNRSSVTFDDS